MKFKILVVLVLLLPLNVNCQQQLEVGLGQWGLFDAQDITALHLGYQLPVNSKLFNLNPHLLLIKAEEGHTYYAVGLSKTFAISGKLSWGLASHAGFLNESQELGNKLEFYTNTFLQYRISKSANLRLEIGHISNAGFGDINPGSESLALSLVTEI